MFKVPCGPTAYFDVDSTLVMFYDDIDFPDKEYVVIECREKTTRLVINKHNLDLLIKLAVRGHAIIVWSKGGSDWSEAVVKALKIEKYVDVVMGKPDYFIDDIADPKEFMGQRQYYKVTGERE